MNGSNVLLAIDTDLNALYHYNTKGSHWYTNGPGKRWQSHAQYAMGKANPDEKRITRKDIENGHRGTQAYFKPLAKTIKDGATKIKAKHDAKLDAAVKTWVDDEDSIGAKVFTTRNKVATAAGVVAGGALGYGVGKLANDALYSRGKVSSVNKYGVSSYGGKMPSNVAMNKFGTSRYVDNRINVTNALVNGKSGKLLKAYNLAKNVATAVNKNGTPLINAVTRTIASPGYNAITGAILGGSAASYAHASRALDNYAKRKSGTLKGLKVSKQYADTYKSNYDKYLKKYSKKDPNKVYDYRDPSAYDDNPPITSTSGMHWRKTK